MSSDTDYILSSRVRLARNLQDLPFLRKLTKNNAESVLQKLQDAISGFNKSNFNEELHHHELNALHQQIFLERHIISPKYATNKLPKGVFTNGNQNISIMANEEDHVRIQSFKEGNNLLHTLSAANRIDDALERHLDFSFDQNLGYLTACPTNVGTGLRASFMIHLPCLDRTDYLKKLLPYITESGMTLRGIYGEGTVSMGSIFQISNQVTIGKSENQIIKKLTIVIQEVIKKEVQVRDNLLSNRKNYLQDKVHRAYGILSHCHRISAKEAMKYLSEIRLGFMADILPAPPKPIYQIMMEVQPGHLHINHDKIMDEVDTDIARADFLRSLF